MRWVNGLSILLWVLSAVLFIISYIFSESQSGGEIIAVIGASGERISLDTLLAEGQIGLVISDSNLENEVNNTSVPPQSKPKSQPLESELLQPDLKPACININTAAEAQLILIKGVGPALAANIIRYREENGAFRKKEDLQNVKGIGSAKMERIAEQVCF